jgi:fumarylacetoacetase
LSPFPVTNLPLGIFTAGDGPARAGMPIGDMVLDLGGLADDLRLPDAGRFAAATLNPFLAAGPASWAELRDRGTEWLTAGRYEQPVRRRLIPLAEVTPRLPFQVADYVDFYASEQHATNLGRLLRPGTAPLTPNWKRLPIGYHGRAGTVVVSGTPVVRPSGLRKVGDDVAYGPSERLDIEAEVGFVVGCPSALGRPVPVDDFAAHVFGVCLVNDWSARDIQAFEYVPLGPFLGKSFATSISPWVVPLAALAQAQVPPPGQDPPPDAYLLGKDLHGYDLRLRILLNGHEIARPPFAALYWTPAQMLAHLTANGAALRTGDLYASGTVSGADQDQFGSLMELSWGGQRPLALPDGQTRTFLADGDEVVITAEAPGPDGTRIGFGEVRGRVHPAVAAAIRS